MSPVWLRRLLLLAVLVPWLGCGGGEPSFETIYRQGYAELARGGLEAARRKGEEGLARAETDADPAWIWAFRVLEAEVLASRRDHEAALALLESASPPDAMSEAVHVRALMTRGLIRCRSSRGGAGLEEGDVLLDEAARRAENLGSVELAGEVDLRRGTCRLGARRLDDAEAFFESALAAARRAGVPHLEANAAGSLGLVRIRSGRFDEATDWLRRTLALAESIGAEIPRVKTINNLGWCHFELGDYERAISLLGEARARAAALGLDGDRLVALVNLGRAHLELDEMERARTHFLRALELARELEDHRRVARLTSNLAIVELAEGRWESAEARTREALELKETLGDAVGHRYSLVTRLRILVAKGVHEEAEALAHRLVDDPATEPFLLSKVHGALALLHKDRGETSEAEAELLRALDYLEAPRQRLHGLESRLAFFSNRKMYYDHYVALLVDSGRERQALEAVLRSRARSLLDRLGEGLEAGARRPVDPREIARSTGAVLLIYWTAPGRSLLWKVDSEGSTLHRLPGEAQLEADVEEYRRAIREGLDPLVDGSPEAERLWRGLVAPVADTLAEGGRVVVLADGPLHRLAFDSLVVQGPRPHYWLEDVVLSSASTLAAVPSVDGRPEVVPGSVLLFGDPLSADPDYPRLLHAGDELGRVAELFGSEKIERFSGAAARPSAYALAGPGRFDYLHLAAHVTAHREIPLDSAVLLSPEGESNKLYARDIVGIPLGARLVTLSACHGAGSRTYVGEGMVGLAWAFLAAGAHNVIAGLWEVDDASTSELMAQLYRGLGQGLGPAEALSRAKLHLLRSGGEWGKPHYWAPFVLTHGPGGLVPGREPRRRSLDSGVGETPADG